MWLTEGLKDAGGDERLVFKFTDDANEALSLSVFHRCNCV